MKIETTFDSIAYRDQFRDFQRQLLKKTDDLLDNSRINLITVPGSGKKLLGLEIIRRIGNPTVIITSSETISAGWCDTFRTDFLPDGAAESAEQYLSNNLLAPKLITAITYEELHNAVNHNVTETADYSSLDLIRMIQDTGIRTLCLDDPHHLPEHCFKALETLLGVMGGEIRVLSLSSIPPYDLNKHDWERFITLCGEINEEIFVPELVKAGTVCPHQDYVYFNYPSEEESAGIRGYRLRADEAITEAMQLSFFGEMNRRILKLHHQNLDFFYTHYDEMLSLLIMLAEYGYPVHHKICRMMTRSNEMPPATLQNAQIAFNFLLESQTILRDGEKEALLEVFRRHRVVEHHRIALASTQKIRRTLVSSAGKLESLAAITEAEDRQQGARLRELVITDEQENDSAAIIGSDSKIYQITPLSVFESIRKRCTWIPMGCLTSNTVVLPDPLRFMLPERYGIAASAFTATPLGTSGYAHFVFKASAKSVLQLISRLLEEGVIRTLVCTEKALGEEWSLPCVNTLIPLCSMSSFVTVPRLRSNILYADKACPDKVAHIWHIATVEKDYSTETHPTLRLASRLASEATGIQSLDFEALRRRFNCFIAPNDTDGELLSGIERLSAIKAPFNAAGLQEINNSMVTAAADRAKTARVWQEAMVENTRPVAEIIVPKKAKVPFFNLTNLLYLVLIAVSVWIFSTFINPSLLLLVLTFAEARLFSYAVILFLSIVLLLLWAVFMFLYLLPWIINHLFARLSVRSLCTALLKTLKEQGEIGSKARLIMENTADKKSYRIYLDDCTAREQSSYQNAVSDMLSPIKNPRYIMVRSGPFHSLRWPWSFACPEVIGESDIAVKIFEKHLRLSMGIMKFQFTHRDPGRKYLIVARNKSYINYRDIKIEKRFHVLKHDRY